MLFSVVDSLMPAMVYPRVIHAHRKAFQRIAKKVQNAAACISLAFFL
jgi:hypothetical protein